MKQRILKVSIITIFSMFLWGKVWESLDTLSRVRGISTNVSSVEIITFTNLIRLNQNITALKPNSVLEKAAEDKAKDMIENDYFNHTDKNGDGPWKFIDQSKYIYQHAGENLARNYNSAEEVVDAWIQSEDHRNNIINPLFNDIGVAVVEDKDQVVIVQLLASEIPPGLINQLEKYQNDFILTTPVSGNKNDFNYGINPNINLFFVSFFMTISIVIITLIIVKLINKQFQSFRSPGASHWRKR